MTYTKPDLQSIVVAVDFSVPSHHAFEEAVRLARTNHARLVVAHFIYDEEMAHLIRWKGLKESDLVAGRKAHLQRWIDDVEASNLIAGIKVEVGHPFAELMKTIENEKADLLMMGAQGENLSQHENSVGAVARSCLRHSPCDILLVRKTHTEPFKSIVVATDFSENSKRAVSEATQFARADKSSLNVVHIFAPNWQHYGERNESREDVDTYLTSLHEKFSDFTYEELDEVEDLEVTFEIQESLSATHGIVEYALENSADLIVLGTVGRSPHRLELPGSTTERVVETSPCSVLTVRPTVTPSWI